MGLCLYISTTSPWRNITKHVYGLTWSDAVPEDTGEPESDSNFNCPKNYVVGIAATKINPEKQIEKLFRTIQ